MFCFNCRKQIPDGTQFCCYCGASQNRVQSTPSPAAQPLTRPATPNSGIQPKQPAGSGTFAKVLSIFIIAAVVYVIFFYDMTARRIRMIPAINGPMT